MKELIETVAAHGEATVVLTACATIFVFIVGAVLNHAIRAWRCK